MTMDKTAVELDALRPAVAQAVATHGLAEAWKRHIGAIAAAHRGEAGAALGASLLAWARQDPAVAACLERLPADARERLDAPPAMSDDPADHHGFLRAMVKRVRAALRPHPGVLEADGRPVSCIEQPFENWGRTVANKPACTFVPRTRAGVANIVKFAIAQGRRVRAAGYRHTWESLFSADGDYLISLLPLDVVEDLPASEPAIDPDNELQGIDFVSTVVEAGVEKAVYRIGAATTNEQFRRWAVQNQAWTVPLNVIMVEITWGGSNAPICHGAGWKHRTLSDLVVAVEFVNARGELQVVDDPAQLTAVSGCFGMLGIVTSISLKLDRMSYARMLPLKAPVALTIPPPAGLALPPQIDISGYSPAQLQGAWDDFVRRAENDYYSEWFWFPLQDECWINTWQNDGAKADSRDYPGPLDSIVQEGEEFLAQLANQSVMKYLPGHLQASLLGAAAMAFLPSGQTITTPLIDALHFRRGIQNMRVLDMELEIPIPARADDPARPDWSVCQKAWWAAICTVYRHYNQPDRSAPMRIALEMRITADSGVTMAPQFGNRWGTCSIEVLTNLNGPADAWQHFMQEIADQWCACTDADGQPLNVRPHWAKLWRGLQFHGQPAVQYLRTVAYRDRIPEFGQALARAAAAGGTTLAQARALFSNPLLDELFAELD